jgi:hypothetical protein
MRNPKSRPDGYVKHLVSVCIDAGMTMDEVHFGTRIPKSHLRSVAYDLGTKFRSPYKPLIQYYVQPHKQV